MENENENLLARPVVGSRPTVNKIRKPEQRDPKTQRVEQLEQQLFVCREFGVIAELTLQRCFESQRRIANNIEQLLYCGKTFSQQRSEYRCQQQTQRDQRIDDKRNANS